MQSCVFCIYLSVADQLTIYWDLIFLVCSKLMKDKTGFWELILFVKHKLKYILMLLRYDNDYNRSIVVRIELILILGTLCFRMEDPNTLKSW